MLTGTYRPDRHGPRTPPAPRMELPYDWKPDPRALGKLSPGAQAFIADARHTYAFNFFAGRVLMEAAATLDLIATCQASIDRHGALLTGPRGRVSVNPLVREHRRHVAWLVRAMKALRLE